MQCIVAAKLTWVAVIYHGSQDSEPLTKSWAKCEARQSQGQFV